MNPKSLFFQAGDVLCFPFDEKHYGCAIVCRTRSYGRTWHYHFILTDCYSSQIPTLNKLLSYSCYSIKILSPAFDQVGYQKYAETLQSLTVEPLKLKRMYASITCSYQIGLWVLMVAQKDLRLFKQAFTQIGKVTFHETWLQLYGASCFGRNLPSFSDRIRTLHHDSKDEKATLIELQQVVSIENSIQQ